MNQKVEPGTSYTIHITVNADGESFGCQFNPPETWEGVVIMQQACKNISDYLLNYMKENNVVVEESFDDVVVTKSLQQ